MDEFLLLDQATCRCNVLRNSVKSETKFLLLNSSHLDFLHLNLIRSLAQQVYDIKIDKINKPDLPLASGEYSVHTALMIIVASAFFSLAIGALSGSPSLLITLVVSMVLGIAYSTDVKFLRWKKNAFGAACCVMIIR